MKNRYREPLQPVKSNKIVIVIPAYLPTLDDQAKLSYHTLRTFCREFDWVLVYPLGLTFDYDTSEFIKRPLARKHFQNYQNYSRLCINPRFYEEFKNYEYMLIFQPDAYMLKDELLKWYDKGYSYLGAPLYFQTWLQGNFFGRKVKSILKRLPVIKNHLKLHAPQIGNGGFSLRHIKDCIKVLRSNQFHFSKAHGCKKKHILIKAWFIALFNKHRRKSDILRRLCQNEQEDLFWVFYAKFLYPAFQFCSVDEGSLFAFDGYFKPGMKRNQNVLPLALHQNIYRLKEYDFFEIFEQANIAGTQTLIDALKKQTLASQENKL